MPSPDDLVPLLGSSSFIPALHAYLRSSSTANLPLDSAIIQAILVCIVAGDKNLILHTPEEDVGLVVRLTFWTLSTIFDLPTHRLKIKPRPPPTTRSLHSDPPTDASAFLRSLFLQPHDDPFEIRSPSRSRSTKFKRSEYLRSSSYSSSHNYPEPLPEVNSPTPMHRDEPTPTQPELPRVLILSGLEDANIIEQRALTTVFMEKKIVIQAPRPNERDSTHPLFTFGSRTHDDGQCKDVSQYYGTWNLPEGFIAIYVCPWNLRERPNINKPLAHYFAMSSTILVNQMTRQAFKALPFWSGHPRTRLLPFTRSNPPTPTVVSLPLPTYTPPTATRPLSGYHQTHTHTHHPPSTPTVPKQLLPRAFLVLLHSVARNAHFSSSLSLYLADLFSAARHHPQLDATFLTVRSMDDAKALARAWRVLGTDPTGSELLRPQKGHFLDVVDGDTRKGGKGESGYEYDGDHSGVALVDHSDRESGLEHGRPGLVPPLLFVSEADVARVVPRAITHRVRVRDGPADEILASAVFGATFTPGLGEVEGDDVEEEEEEEDGYGWDTRRTIKEILVNILAEV